MPKTILIFLIVILGSIKASAQDPVEAIDADDVLQLLRGYGLSYADPSPGRPALLVLSLGCSHCIDLASKYQHKLKHYFDANNLQVSLIEMPQAVSKGPPELRTPALRAAGMASLLLECTNGRQAEDLLALMNDLGKTARSVVGEMPDAAHPKTTNWKDWVHLATSNDEGELQSTAMDVMRLVVGQRDVDVATCGQQGEGDRILARLDAFRNAKIMQVPALYLLPDENHPELEVLPYSALVAMGQSAAAD